MTDPDPVKPRRPRMTPEEAWAPRNENLLKIATEEEIDGLVSAARAAERAADLKARVIGLRAKADAAEADAKAEAAKDTRDALAETLRQRMLAEASR